MLAELARELPEGDGLAFEPKWDGFRCLAFAAPDGIDLRSRNQRPLARFFPELCEAFRARAGLVLDGEIVIARPTGLDFPALLGRMHPSASRVARLAREAPATFVAFDLLAERGEDLRALPFAERRARLVAALRGAPAALRATPATGDRGTARRWLERLQGHGIDGVVAKALALPYREGKRAMVKVKRERTADCVVAGLRTLGPAPAVGSLLLGLWDGPLLRHVGVASSFRDARRRELFAALSPLGAPLDGHPWQAGFNLEHSPVGRLAGSAGRWDPREMAQDWTALRPERVCEVAFDQLDLDRFRHPARFLRWRPDRDAASCTFDQLGAPAPRGGTGPEALRWP